MIPRNVALIVHFHLTHLLPLSTSIFLLPPPNPHFYWYQRTQETSRQVWYQPNFCRSKKLYKPPESKTVWRVDCSFPTGLPIPLWTLVPRRVGGLSPYFLHTGKQICHERARVGSDLDAWSPRLCRALQTTPVSALEHGLTVVSEISTCRDLHGMHTSPGWATGCRPLWKN